MNLYNAKLNQNIERTPSVRSFRFVPEKKIDFIPGQFLKLVLDGKNIDNKELNKYLSFSSAPAKDYIEVTKRISESQFSQNLKNLKINDQILIQGPLGNCVFKDEYQNIGFLIGGIGITPVISIIEYIMDKKINTRVTLLYSNRNEKEIAFRKELDFWKNRNPNIKVIHVLSEAKSQDPALLFGCIDKDLILSRLPELKEKIIFIFGPPKMVEAMNGLCLDLGCDKNNLVTENFIGY